MDFQNNELKPILGRVRSQTKKLLSQNQKKKVITQSSTKGSNKNVYVDFINEYESEIKNITSDVDMKKVIELKQNIMERAKTILQEDKEFSDRMSDADKQILFDILDPVSKARESILTLPTTISKIYEISNLEIMPTIYEKDHVWLSLQWMIDDVENPFNSRPCSSNPCLGNYIQKEGGGNLNQPLPEIVPLNTLDTFRDYRSRGFTTQQFKEELLQKRQEILELTYAYTLGRDICGEPRCILCIMKDMYCMLTKSSSSKTEINLKHCKRNLSLNFVGLSEDFSIEGSLLSSDFVLSESNVSLPIGKIPLIGAIMYAIYQRNNKEIVIEGIYKH